MNSNKNLTPLTSNNNATYKVVDGVTYFKLKSEFDGDYTKHCGLLGEEIDENFYFLRGYDIDSIFPANPIIHSLSPTSPSFFLCFHHSSSDFLQSSQISNLLP